MLSICLVVLMPPGSYARPLLDSKKLTSRQLVDEAPALIESSPKSKEVIVECQLSVGSPGLAGIVLAPSVRPPLRLGVAALGADIVRRVAGNRRVPEMCCADNPCR
jgi:hypothetical protein